MLLLLLVLLGSGGQVEGGQVDGGQVEALQEIGVPVLLSRATTLVRVGHRLSFSIVNIIKICTLLFFKSLHRF